MKIALPTRNNEIDSHFGHCAYYTVFTLNDSKEVIAQELLASPAGCGCKSNIAQVLSEMGVELMLAGNMGDGAVHVLSNAGIGVVRGCSGNVYAVIRRWIDGQINDSGVGCAAHEHGCH